MRAYLSIKYEGDDNEETVQSLCTAAERAGFLVSCTNRDFDDFGRNDRDPEELMPFMQDAIEQADVLLLDLTDKGVGLGVEAGYGAALGKPIVALAHEDAEIPTTIEALARRVIRYQGFDDLTEQLGSVKRTLGKEAV
ncbi:hypothetical protein HY374_01920 [Candidatus Berkelbacteria bacterium]|nr:hypothetical protein [Candidatus Berkelbacteria bacterium]